MWVRRAPSHSKASEQLVAQRLRLGDGAQAAVVHLLRVQLYAAVGELEPLLHDAGQLPDAAALLTWQEAEGIRVKLTSLQPTMSKGREHGR